MTAALTFDSVSKHFRGTRGYRALRDDLASLLPRPGRRRRVKTPEIRALDGVSFEVQPGQAFSIVGPNGSGKSTALKVAARVTRPTSGRILVKGRLAGLIEVGAGVHPELTGAENIALSARILGMSSRQIRERFAAIVEFSGLAPALFQPVKQYSTGMQLRLGFSIIAHLEPEVLLVDEALAVGDAAFQERCMERMRQLVAGGTALVLVSHQLTAVESMSDHAVLMQAGRVTYRGGGREVVQEYLRQVQDELQSEGRGPLAGQGIEVINILLMDQNGNRVREVPTGGAVTLRIEYRAEAEVLNPSISLGLIDPALGMLASASTLLDGERPARLARAGHIDCVIPRLDLRGRSYDIYGAIGSGESYGDVLPWQRLSTLSVVEETNHLPAEMAQTMATLAPMVIPHSWRFAVRDSASALPS